MRYVIKERTYRDGYKTYPVFRKRFLRPLEYLQIFGKAADAEAYVKDQAGWPKVKIHGYYDKDGREEYEVF
jgi:hypothetical protein